MSIHPSAIVSPEAKIGKNVSIGAYSIIEGKVEIGENSKIFHHACIGSPKAHIKIGKNNQIFPGAMIGNESQDLTSRQGHEGFLEIGNGNIFREFTTVNLGSVKASQMTKIGSNNTFMAYVHIAHDCLIGNHVVVANCGQFAGHIQVGDHVRVSGVCSFSQFVRLGSYSYIGGGSLVNKDVLPYSIAEGSFATTRATNKIGMQRAGFSKKEIDDIHRALRILIKGNLILKEGIKKIKERLKEHPSTHVSDLIQFIEASQKGFAR